MARTELRGGQIKDETIDSADLASGSIKAGELSSQVISGQTLITEPAGAADRLLIWDATDSALKQVAPDNLFTEVDTRIGIGTGADVPDNTLHVKSPGTCHIKIQSEDGYEAALRLKAGTGGSTYIWTPGNTSDIRFYAGGADRMHIDNDGSVGIGTTSPSDLFTVESTSAFMSVARNTSNNAGGAVITVDNSRGGNNGVAEDYCGAIRFNANDSGGASTQYAKISGMVHSPTNDSEIGRIVFETTTPLANKGTPLYLRGNAVHILSGGAGASIDEANGTDVAFYVSGAIGSAGTMDRGTSLFGGDVFSSGTFYGVSGMRIDTSTELHALNIDPLLETVSFFKEDTPGLDTNWFVSGSIGGTINHAAFGGDLVVSGNLYVDKIRRASDSGTTTKINLNDEVIKLYAGHGSNQICTVSAAGLKIDNGILDTDALVTKSVAVNVRDVNSTSTVQATDYILRCTQTSAITITLPAKSSNAGRVLIFKDAMGSAGNPNNDTITLDGDGSDTIDDSATYVVDRNGESVTLTCDGASGWMITSRVVP